MLSQASWRVYDAYLKANRVEAGTASYAQVVQLILGSGMSFHNMRAFGARGALEVSERFDRWMGEACGKPAAAFFKVIARARRAPSATLTSSAIRTPPIAGPVATLSTTRIARSPS